MGKYGDILLNPEGAVAILTFINFLNYVDRGIIPGASTSLRGCLYDNQTCPTWAPMSPTQQAGACSAQCAMQAVLR